ncbi:Vitamin-D-receptor interacting Mediator subunit 4 [Phytophthora infestans]|uniref:Mediator of RNA polymerase II transcription subunit 4 n=1 Tax=Phytophthora infestans TaxID=4787 RepID=A0A833WRL0_PHYIN|nr:Vitamin-D-receptor interacting Mediator subunit 4 [Phytophthora infestans]
MPQMGGSIREEMEVALHEHRFLVTKLLESLNTASLPPSTITATRLRTVNETFNKVLEKDRDLLTAVKKLARHQVAQKELLRIEAEIENKKQKVVQYAAQLRCSQEDIADALRKHRVTLQNTKQKSKVVLDPRDIVAYAHRIAGTTSAPKEWQPGFPMFGFMPPAPQEHMMRAGVLSRGIVAEIVTQGPEKYTSTAARVSKEGDGDAMEKLNIPIGLGASDAQIRKQMPPGWKPGDPVDLPLDALLHYMDGRPAPPDAMEILRKKFKLPEKRAALYDDEVVDDVESLRKKRKLEEGDKADEGTAESDSSSDSSDSDEEAPNTISLSLSSSEDESDDDSD